MIDCLKEVFGSNIWTWFMPVHTAIGDGLTFPTNLSTHEVERGPSYQSFNMRTVGTLEENNDGRLKYIHVGAI